MLVDSYNRRIEDLRVSLTDRCNFNCFYCSAGSNQSYAPKDQILSFEELFEICSIFVGLGIKKIRLTGGEPLLRKDIAKLVRRIARLKCPPLQDNSEANTLCDLAMTTNGFSLETKAEKLKFAGLDRVTISLDSLNRRKFQEITGADRLEEVLRSIGAAKTAGLNPVKINSVIIRGVNDDEILDLIEFSRNHEIVLRFIEFMPLDVGRKWKREKVVPAKEILSIVKTKFDLTEIDPAVSHETARRFGFADGNSAEFGLISPVSEPFCNACSRIRLTADGQIRTCLFSTREFDAKKLIRDKKTSEEIAAFIVSVVNQKEFGHLINDPQFEPASRSMRFIGG